VVLLFAGYSAENVVSQEEPAATTDISAYSVPDEAPPPIPLRLGDTDRYLGSECDGTDPIMTECNADGYTQGPPVPVVGPDGVPFAMLELRGSHNKCDSTQWAQASQLGEPLTFALRVRQCETGLATEWRVFTNYEEETAQSAQMSSKQLCVWPELALQDENGNWRITGVAWPA